MTTRRNDIGGIRDMMEKNKKLAVGGRSLFRQAGVCQRSGHPSNRGQFLKRHQKLEPRSTEEAMLAEAVPFILKPYGFKEVWILVEGKHDESVFSHMGADRPFQAKNPDTHKWVQE